MTADDRAPRGHVTERGAVTVPRSVREELDLEAGDTVRWRVDGDEATIEVVGEVAGAFGDFEPVEAGEMDAVEEHDTGFVEDPE